MEDALSDDIGVMFQAMRVGLTGMLNSFYLASVAIRNDNALTITFYAQRRVWRDRAQSLITSIKVALSE